MALPATIFYTPLGNEWPLHRNARLGPYVAAGLLLAFCPDYGVDVARAFYSSDQGHTWAEADAENAPPISGLNLHQTISVAQNSSTFYVCAPLDATNCTIAPFDAVTLTWSTPLVGPSFTWAAVGTTNVTTGVWNYYRAADAKHIIVAQLPIVSTFRQCALYHGVPGSWNGPFYLGTGTSTPYSGFNNDLVHLIAGASDRLHLFWGEGSNNLRSRVFTASNTFGTVVDLGFIVLPSNFPGGIGSTYEDSGTKIAAVFAPGNLPNVQTTVCTVDSLTSDTAANWTITTVSASGGNNSNTNAGVVVSDGGGKLYLLRVNQGVRTLSWADGDLAGNWSEWNLWKPDTLQEIYGISGAFLNDRIGFFYSTNPIDGSGSKLYYDAIHVYQSKASRGAGEYTTEHDLGVGGVSDYLILKDASAPTGVSSTIEVRTREDEGVAYPEEAWITFGTEEGTDSRDVGSTGQTARFVQITETVVETIPATEMTEGVTGI